MSRIGFEPWEPEESVGKLWHALASRLDAPKVHDTARCDLSEVAGRLAVLFRGLGGDPSVEIKPVGDEIAAHRLSFLRRLGHEVERSPRASFDGAALRLPGSLAIFPDRAANGALYVWLTALAAHAPAPGPLPRDPLAADLAALAAARAMVAATVANAPGLAGLGRELAGIALAQRPPARLPAHEAAVESLIRQALGDPAPLTGLAADLAAGARRRSRRAATSRSARCRSGPTCAPPTPASAARSRPATPMAPPRTPRAPARSAPAAAPPIRPTGRTA